MPHSPSTLGTCRSVALPMCVLLLLGALTPAFAGDIVVGSFLKSTTTGTQVVSHSLGVTPKAIITWTTHVTSESSTATAIFGLGFSDGTTEYAISGDSDDALGTSDTTTRHTDKVIHVRSNCEADLTSWNSTTFTLDWTTNLGTASRIHYMLIGGSDISAKVLSWNTSGSTGTQAVTGVGFKPDVALHFHSATIASVPNAVNNWDMSIGAMDANGRQWAISNYILDNQGTTNAQRGQRTNRCFFDLNSNLTTWREGAYSSMDTDGFSISWTANQDAVAVSTLCLSGVNAHAGSFSKSTAGAPASQAVTGVNFEPELLLLASWQRTAATTGQIHGRLGFGGTDGTTEGSVAYQDTDAIGTSAADRIGKTSKVFVKMDNSSGTVDAEADLTSLDADGFTLNWTTNDAVATEMLFLALTPFDSMAVTWGGAKAHLGPQGAQIEWKTTSQTNSLGFRVHRDRRGTDLVGWVPVLTAARLSPLLAASSYSIVDPRGTVSTEYWIEEVDRSGQSNWFGPVRVQSASTTPPTISAAAVAPPTLAATPAWEPVSIDDPALDRTTEKARLRAQWKVASARAPRPIPLEIGVRETGWTRVTACSLFAAGLDPLVDPRALELSADGVPIAVEIHGEADGRLDLGDTLEFYASASENRESDLRVYWLSIVRSPPARIRTAPGLARGTIGDHATITRVHRPRENYFAALLNGPGNNFFGPLVTASSTEFQIPLSTWRDARRSPIELEWILQPLGDGDHSVIWSVDGTDRGTVAWSGAAAKSHCVKIPPSWITNPDPIFSLRSTANGDLLFVDRLITRTNERTETGGEPLFVSLAPGRELSIEGLDASTAVLLDLTDPRAPRRLAPAPGSSSARTRLRPVGAVAVPLLALSESEARSPDFVRQGSPSSWHDKTHEGRLVVIADAMFHPTLERLVRLREHAGWTTALIATQDLYDEFSFGTPDSRAIPRFLEQAEQWREPPEALLLVGDATYDPRGYLGSAPAASLPGHLFDSDDFETTSDELLVDRTGDALGEITVGRFPVSTVAECEAWVQKSIAYKPRGSDGVSKALLLTDQAGDFDYQELVDEQWSTTPTSLSVEKIHLDQFDIATARAALFAQLASGVDLVYYLGHGGRSIWSSGGVLTNSDAASLTNGPDHPVVISMSCLNGFYHHPNSESLAEAFGNAGLGGAVAVWAPSILAGPAVQRELSAALIEQLTVVRPPTLGEAVRSAKRAVSDRTVRAGWILFGDPTLPLVFSP